MPISPGVRSIALEEQPDGNAIAARSRIVVIGVKPGMVPDLLAEIAPHLSEDAIVVSVAAGVTLAGRVQSSSAGLSSGAAGPPWWQPAARIASATKAFRIASF